MMTKYEILVLSWQEFFSGEVKLTNALTKEKGKNN